MKASLILLPAALTLALAVIFACGKDTVKESEVKTQPCILKAVEITTHEIMVGGPWKCNGTDVITEAVPIYGQSGKLVAVKLHCSRMFCN